MTTTRCYKELELQHHLIVSLSVQLMTSRVCVLLKHVSANIYN